MFALATLAAGLFPIPALAADPSNTQYGASALGNAPTGTHNSAFGFEALYSDKAGYSNTAVGSVSLLSNVDGAQNTAVGVEALFSTTTSDNTAVGYRALLENTTGTQNTASGSGALNGASSGSTGSYNTATGFHSLYSNGNGDHNVADGWLALFADISGAYNTATGDQALYSNQTGSTNTATGSGALYTNNTGGGNTADGFQALVNNKGSDNIAVGINAGFKLTNGNGNIDIGNQGVAGESGKIRLGTKGSQTAAFIAGIYGKTVASGVGVIINSNGLLGTVQSSARFKEAIQPMAKASEAILSLKPVTFRYKEELDPDKIPQFGLIAEEVEKVNRDLVVRDDDGQVSTVRYEAVNAMLLNEFLKEHRKVEQQGTTIARLEKQVGALSAGLQKVNAKVELGRVPQFTSTH
jgi:hypothetical protein